MSQPRPLFWLRAGQTVSNSFVLSAKQSSRTSNLNVFDAAGDRTTNLPHARRTLNHYTTRPRCVCFQNYKYCMYISHITFNKHQHNCHTHCIRLLEGATTGEHMHYLRCRVVYCTSSSPWTCSTRPDTQGSEWVISKFNGTSTPKGSYRAKTGVKCTMSLSRVY